MFSRTTKRLFAALLAVFLWSGHGSTAQAITIDAFTDPYFHFGFEPPVGSPPSGIGPFPPLPPMVGPGILGERSVNLGFDQTLVISSGSLSLESPFIFDASLRYDFGGIGDGFVDLTAGGATGFSLDDFSLGLTPTFDVAIFPFGLEIIVEAGGGDDSASFFGIIDPFFLPPGPFDLVVPYALFGPGLGGPFPFFATSAVTLAFTSLDDPAFTISGFSTVAPVPIPAALPLFLSGLVGLGVMARRRKHKIAEA